MWGASAFPIAVGKPEIGPREAPAKEDGYKHLFMRVGH